MMGATGIQNTGIAGQTHPPMGAVNPTAINSMNFHSPGLHALGQSLQRQTGMMPAQSVSGAEGGLMQNQMAQHFNGMLNNANAQSTTGVQNAGNGNKLFEGNGGETGQQNAMGFNNLLGLGAS